MLDAFAKGGGSSGGRSSSSTSRSSSSSSSKSTTSAKPGSKVTTSSGKTVQTSSKTPTNAKYKNSAGIVGADGYSAPRFTNGYNAPAGSVVYYPDHSFIDYLPWIYLFSQSSPRNDNVVVMQPDGKEVTEQPVQDGVDGMLIFNWILLILIALAIIGGIIWGVYKWTNRKN